MAAFPTPDKLDAELKDMRTCMQLFKMNLGLHNPVEYNVEENSLLRDFHTQMRASHVRCGFLLAEAKDEPTKEKLNKVADELDAHFKLFTDAKNKYSKKARNIKMVQPVKGGAVLKKGAVRVAFPNKEKAVQAMRVLRDASAKNPAPAPTADGVPGIASTLNNDQISELKELLGDDWMDFVDGLMDMDENTISEIEEDLEDDLASKLLSKTSLEGGADA